MASAQGTFQDLDFEQASTSLGYTSATLFPGWQLYMGTTPTTFVGYDQSPLSTPLISLWDNGTGYTPIQGNYTAILASASGGGDPAHYNG
jgi:hypothetical protein